jgi:hypothetical protein
MSRLEELRKKHRPQPHLVIDPNLLTVEDAIRPFLERFKDYDKGQLMNLGGGACCCSGPAKNMPLCHCALILKAQEILLDEWYVKNET